MNQVKVLFILNDLGGGGAEKVFIHLANGFKSNGLEVEILLAENKGVFFNLVSSEIPLHILGTKSFFGLIKKLPAFLKGKSYTHVFVAFDYISAATVISNMILRQKFITVATLHYYLPYQLAVLPRANRIWLQFLNKYIITKAQKLVSVSNGVGEGFKKVVQDNDLYVQTIYNPVVEPTLFNLAKEDIDDCYKKMNYIITIGRLDEQKNQKRLLYSFRSVLQKRPDLHLLILGAGSKEAELKETSKMLSIQKNVHFLGFQSNPYKYLLHAKLFVLSSDYEGLGNVIIEALALGINVVSTDCLSGPREILDDEKYGWLAKMNHPDDLAAKIILALDNLKPGGFLKERSKLFEKDLIVEKYMTLLKL